MVIKGISSSISPPLHQHMQPHTHTKVQRTGTSTSSQVHESDTTCKSPYAYQMFASTKTVDRKFNTKAIPQQKKLQNRKAHLYKAHTHACVERDGPTMKGIILHTRKQN